MEGIIPDVPGCAGGSSAEVVLQNLKLTECLWVGVWNQRVSLSMVFWRRGEFDVTTAQVQAVSSAKSATWTPVCKRGMSFVYAEYKRGECGALSNSGSNQSFGRCAIFMPEGEVSDR
ncbi:hypothetical protein EVAR_58121_1 [Eumeta japonica]|uniref:Uncharacterized protein n=1 Tax=Eumeta variegata TaxID=151549 RepID=A0A4C1YS64_EUMVA|nr:hypothetical protein EVAR_58121_1 [Eumeta japonica]